MKNLFPVFILLLLAGCNGKPSDVPKLFPCKITVKQEATPIAGADVILGSDSAGSMWTASGTTDSSGVAKIHTNRLQWQGEGIPVGEYTVILSKTPKLESISVEEYQKLDPMEQDKYRAEQAKKFDDLPREIPVELSEFSNSPFKLTVTEGGENNLEIDISTYKPAKPKKK